MGVRRLPLGNYPYVIFYTVEADEVAILRIRHGARRPRNLSGIEHPLRDCVGISFRRYRPRDEDAAIALWLRTWQAAYPQLDFAARLDWWRERWRNELVPRPRS